MAAVSIRKQYTGHPDLGRNVDPDTWLTPRWILDCLGPFDLDPCAAEIAPQWVGCARSFTKAENGLLLAWKGRVFMNPPFSSTSTWLRKHAEHGNGISLVPATVESEVWRKFVWPKAKGILLTHGRIRFCNPDGSTTTGRPLRSIALIAWTEFDLRFLMRAPIAGVLLRTWLTLPADRSRRRRASVAEDASLEAK